MTMAQFHEEEALARATNKDCELCGTWVNIELEHLAEKGCVYCYVDDPKPGLLADIKDHLFPYMAGDWPIEGEVEIKHVDLLVRASKRINQLETALGEVMHIFDNGIATDEWDAYEERMRKALVEESD